MPFGCCKNVADRALWIKIAPKNARYSAIRSVHGMGVAITPMVLRAAIRAVSVLRASTSITLPPDGAATTAAGCHCDRKMTKAVAARS